ncbi:M23 family metallopeptidase [candidate division WOR-3 bacterium]|nr:M23 family metallopeptidase [candidate division WOR-3 bacterium]
MKITRWLLLFFIINLCQNCVRGNVSEEDTEMKVGKNKVGKEELSYEERIEILKESIEELVKVANRDTRFHGQLPNAPRKYRNGFHEGIDFYDGFCGVKIEEGTPVLSIADGKVIRVDKQYVEISIEKRDELLAEAYNCGYTPDSTLDILRGMQVWIDHRNGIVTRYCHLSKINPGLKGEVKKGEIIGFVGGSGTKSKTPHLHFEIRIGEDFLGKGKSTDENLKLLEEIFNK